MNVLSLCSGIGGLDIGLKIAEPDARVVGWVEGDPSCQEVLLARMADGVLDRAPIYGNVVSFDAGRWRGLVDCVAGGYPCQPFSTAGKRRGAEDERYLWPHVARIVAAVEPEWCFFENVSGHLSDGAPAVVADLAGMGFSVALGFFTAAELGAPHERERLFILAHSDSQDLVPPNQPRDSDADGLDRGRTGVQGVGGDAEEARGEEAVAVAPGIAALERPGPWPLARKDPAWRDVLAADPSLAPGVEEGGRRRKNPAFVECLMGFPRGWTDGLGLPRARRLEMLGNAVVPAAAALAWRELSAALERGARVGRSEEGRGSTSKSG